MANVTIFNSPQFGDIRTAGTSEQPLFCLADVCKALELQPSRVKDRLECGVISTHPIVDSLGREQVANFVNEDGLYDVILDSRKKEAKAFRKWITSDVLPSFRKTGGYIATTPEMSDAEILERALLIANNNIRQREARIKELKSENEQQRMLLEDREVVIGKQTEELEKAAPKVQYYDNVMQSTTTYTVQQIAKELDMTAVKLYAYLKEKKVMFKQSGIWMLATKYRGKGYTKMRTHTFTRSDGTLGTSSYTVITELGRRFIHEIVSKCLQNKIKVNG